jgi:hypothetical protein
MAQIEPDLQSADGMQAETVTSQAATVHPVHTATQEEAPPADTESTPAPTVDPLDPWAAWTTAPASSDGPPASDAATVASAPKPNTRAIWWLVAMPLLEAAAFAAVLAAVTFTLFPTLLSDPTAAVLPTTDVTLLLGLAGASVGISVLGLVVTVLLSVRDRRALRARGFTRTASPWWNLLGPFVYLLVRAIAVRGRATVPLTVYVCLYVLPGLVAGVVGAVLQQS